MQTRYIFCLLWSALVLAVAAQKSTTEVTAPNEFQCPACRNETEDNCAEEVVSCQGDENFCANSNVTIWNEDKTANSTLVVKGCVPQLVLSALLKTKDVETGYTYEIHSVIEVAPRKPTEPPTTVEMTSEKTTETTITEKTTEMAITKKNNSPHISSSLSFTLWLPSMSWLLLMTLLS